MNNKEGGPRGSPSVYVSVRILESERETDVEVRYGAVAYFSGYAEIAGKIIPAADYLGKSETCAGVTGFLLAAHITI